MDRFLTLWARSDRWLGDRYRSRMPACVGLEPYDPLIMSPMDTRGVAIEAARGIQLPDLCLKEGAAHPLNDSLFGAQFGRTWPIC